MDSNKLSIFLVLALTAMIVTMAFDITKKNKEIEKLQECGKEKIELLFKMDQIVQHCQSFK